MIALALLIGHEAHLIEGKASSLRRKAQAIFGEQVGSRRNIYKTVHAYASYSKRVPDIAGRIGSQRDWAKIIIETSPSGDNDD